MKAIHAERLMKLARFLHNVLPEHKFDFSWVIQGKDLPNKRYDCGTVACAIGWMPHVFPRRYQFLKIDGPYHHEYVDGQIVLMDKKTKRTMGRSLDEDALTEFFGMTSTDISGLFAPRCQAFLDLPILNNNAKPKEVAKNIATFVRRQRTGVDTKLKP